MMNEKKIDYYGNEVERIMKDGEAYLVYDWEGHKLMFLEEDVEVFEFVMLTPIEMSFSIYAHIDLKKPVQEATTEEVKDAILHGANEELSLYRMRLAEQAKEDVPDPSYGYNEKVGIHFFREPQDLEDKETAWQHQNKWCIMKRCGEGTRPKVFCYADIEKYNERIKTLFMKDYLGKGYDLFFHKGNGEGYYEEFPEDDKTIQAEYIKDGVQYYNDSVDYNSLYFTMQGFREGKERYRVVTVDEKDRPDKLVCCAIEPQYNDKVLEVYRKEYFEKGYYLLGMRQ